MGRGGVSLSEFRVANACLSRFGERGASESVLARSLWRDCALCGARTPSSLHLSPHRALQRKAQLLFLSQYTQNTHACYPCFFAFGEVGATSALSLHDSLSPRADSVAATRRRASRPRAVSRPQARPRGSGCAPIHSRAARCDERGGENATHASGGDAPRVRESERRNRRAPRRCAASPARAAAAPTSGSTA